MHAMEWKGNLSGLAVLDDLMRTSQRTDQRTTYGLLVCSDWRLRNGLAKSSIWSRGHDVDVSAQGMLILLHQAPDFWIPDQHSLPRIAAMARARLVDRIRGSARLHACCLWVSAKIWPPTSSLGRKLPHFIIVHVWPNWTTKRWLTAYLPWISTMIRGRDVALAAPRSLKRDRDGFESRYLKNLAKRPIATPRDIKDFRFQRR